MTWLKLHEQPVENHKAHAKTPDETAEWHPRIVKGMFTRPIVELEQWVSNYKRVVPYGTRRTWFENDSDFFLRLWAPSVQILLQ